MPSFVFGRFFDEKSNKISVYFCFVGFNASVTNTILSKANDITVSNIAIDLKTEIEKIREQIQNIE